MSATETGAARVDTRDVLYPPPITSPADDGDEQPARPCIAPPADDRLKLIRWDLRCSAENFTSLESLVNMIDGAESASDWRIVSADLRTMRGRTGDTQSRGVLTAASAAAGWLSAGDLGRALKALADLCDLTAEQWIEVTRETRASSMLKR